MSDSIRPPASGNITAIASGTATARSEEKLQVAREYAIECTTQFLDFAQSFSAARSFAADANQAFAQFSANFSDLVQAFDAAQSRAEAANNALIKLNVALADLEAFTTALARGLDAAR